MRPGRVQGELILMGTALMFLTRLPVGDWCSPRPEDLSRSTRWFPLVGLIVGLLLSAVYLVSSLFLPPSVCIVLLLLAGVRVTGAFHEDGLADVADSAGAFDLDSKLTIMRDSRVGTYGALALVLLVALKGVLLFELSEIDTHVLVSALIVSHVCSRWSSVWLMTQHGYVRPEAANKVVAEGITTGRLLQTTLVATLILLPVALIGSWMLILVIPVVVWSSAWFSGRYFERTLGGITGDCLGAGNQAVELCVLVGMLALFSVS